MPYFELWHSRRKWAICYTVHCSKMSHQAV
jgi:hypothetical protein